MRTLTAAKHKQIHRCNKASEFVINPVLCWPPHWDSVQPNYAKWTDLQAVIKLSFLSEHGAVFNTTGSKILSEYTLTSHTIINIFTLAMIAGIVQAKSFSIDLLLNTVMSLRDLHVLWYGVSITVIIKAVETFC